MLIKNNVHVTCPWVIKNVESAGSFKGYASVFYELDDQGDRVLPGAFADTIKQWQSRRQAPKMLWQHDQTEPIGWWKLINEDQQGLYVEGQLLLSLQKAQQIYEMLKSGMIDGLSIGCRVLEAESEISTGERLLKSLDLFEISLVTFAANTSARIKTIKSKSPIDVPTIAPSNARQTSRDLLESLRHTQQLLKVDG